MQNDLHALQNRLRPLATSPSLCHSISVLCIHFVYQDFPARETFLPTLCADGKVVGLSETKCLEGRGRSFCGAYGGPAPPPLPATAILSLQDISFNFLPISRSI